MVVEKNVGITERFFDNHYITIKVTIVIDVNLVLSFQYKYSYIATTKTLRDTAAWLTMDPIY